MVQVSSEVLRDKVGNINQESWFGYLRKLYPEQKVLLIKDALEFLKSKVSNNSIDSGLALEPGSEFSSWFKSGVDSAVLLSELRADPYAVIASLYFKLYQDSPNNINNNDLDKYPQIKDILEALIKIETLSGTDNTGKEILEQQTDMIRKMLLSMVSDVRIVLVKLANQVVLMRNIKDIRSPSEKIAIANIILKIYAPLANRLGIGQLKWELEDRAFAIIDSDNYQNIKQILNEKRIDREQRLYLAKDTLIQEIDKLGVEAQIQGRVKHIYSISKKISKKNLDFSGLYDIQALRVLVEDVSLCYRVLSLLNELWDPVISEFSDYIATPKPNGYQSIHAVLEVNPDEYIEVQIRTFKMHEDSEVGVAAHWQYKEGKSLRVSDHQRINWLRGLLDWQREVSTDLGDQSVSKLDTHIYVFTPRGDVFELSVGATVLDFAYHIHTDVGHRFRGAKVNHKMVPINYTLRTGDNVEILTHKNPNPSRDWLDSSLKIVNTSKARAKISNYFRKHDYDLHVQNGKQKFIDALTLAGFKKIDFDSMADKFNVKTAIDLYAAVDRGVLRLNSVLNEIKKLEDDGSKSKDDILSSLLKSKINKETQKATSYQGFIIEDIDQVMSNTAKCCLPVLGDDIIGYVTQGRGISIHRDNCPHVARLVKKYPKRIMKVKWSAGFEQNLPSQLKLFLPQVQSFEQQDFLKSLTVLLFNEKCTITKMNSYYVRREQLFVVELRVLVGNVDLLESIINKLSAIKSVAEVVRVCG